MNPLEQVRRTIEKYGLLKKNDSVLIALSGGPDSVALLRLLYSLRKEYCLSLTAIYINHQIRPRSAAKEERFCLALCAKRNIPLIMAKENVPALAKKHHRGIEETAREIRYQLFEKFADQGEFDHIALGHHRDDRAETVLFRILRGTGPAGLVGIPAHRGRIIRPLYDLSREQILSYLKRRKQNYCEDRSNLSLKYTRNLIRHRLLPLARERINSRVEEALVSLSEITAEQEAFLENYELRAFKSVAQLTPAGKISLDLDRLGGYDKWLRARLLRRCLKWFSDNSLPPSRETLERLDRLVQVQGKGLSLPGHLQAAIFDRRLILYRKRNIRCTVELRLGGTVELREIGCRVRCRFEALGDKTVERKRLAGTVRLDFDCLRPPLVVRSIKAGDRFTPLGMRGSKKVGDFLTDRKVPPVLRDEIPVLADQAGIVWVPGYEIADRVKIVRTTKRILRVTYSTFKSRQAHSL